MALSEQEITYRVVTGLLRVTRYGVRVLNRMVSFFNAQPATRNSQHHLSMQKQQSV
jgi:hypothetical protein